jgi:dimethylamine monooxygenase subunit C
MGAAHTSVPRWPTTDPGVDRTGRAFAIMAFGPGAAPVAERWHREVARLGRPVWVRRVEGADDAVLTELDERVAAARVGWRLMLAGPQADVLAAYAVATRAGFLAAEIAVLVTDDRHRRVWCAHCDTTSLAEVATGDVTPCAGCGRSLLVYHHVSRRSAAYLGFMADAEERP